MNQGFLAAVADTVTFPESSGRIPQNFLGKTDCAMVINYRNGNPRVYVGHCWDDIDFSQESGKGNVHGFPRAYVIEHLLGSESRFSKGYK